MCIRDFAVVDLRAKPQYNIVSPYLTRALNRQIISAG